MVNNTNHNIWCAVTTKNTFNCVGMLGEGEGGCDLVITKIRPGFWLFILKYIRYCTLKNKSPLLNFKNGICKFDVSYPIGYFYVNICSDSDLYKLVWYNDYKNRVLYEDNISKKNIKNIEGNGILDNLTIYLLYPFKFN